jgi:hypothetical protein
MYIFMYVYEYVCICIYVFMHVYEHDCDVVIHNYMYYILDIEGTCAYTYIYIHNCYITVMLIDMHKHAYTVM